MGIQPHDYRGYRIVIRDTAAVGGHGYMRPTANGRSSVRTLMIQLVVTIYWRRQSVSSMT